MDLEFQTKQMTSAMKAVKKMFDKGPFTDADAGGSDCLIASLNDGTAMLESAAPGLYTKAIFPADVQTEGRVAISRSVLHALKLQGDVTTLQYRDGTNKLKFKSGQFNGELVVSEAFDEIDAARPDSLPELTISLSALTAKAAAKRTCLNATLDTLLRMKLTVEGRQMTLSCNDSFRAAAVRSNLDDDAEGEGEIEVPAVFFNTVMQSIEDQHVRIGFNDRVFRIAGGGYDVCHSVLSESEKPMVDVFGRFEQLKKTEPLVIATIDAAAIREALGAVMSVAPSGNNDVRVDLNFSEKTKRLVTSVRSATSQGKFAIPVSNLVLNQKQPIVISAKYLLEMFNLMSTDDATLYGWERLAVLQSEKVGCCMIMPQLKSRDDD